MTELPSMPLFVDAFDSDTGHLSLEEDGAYNRLLRLCWKTADCSVPDDPSWIARKLRLTPVDFERVVVPIIAEFFTRESGRIFQKRQRKEFAYVREKRTRLQEAGQKGGKAKSLKLNETASSDALAMDAKAPTPTPTPTLHLDNQTDSSEVVDSPAALSQAKRAPSKGTRLDPNWALPKPWGDWALAEFPHLTADNVRLLAEDFRDYWHSKSGKDATKVDWQATWRNSVRMKQDRFATRSRAGPVPKSNGLSSIKDRIRKDIENGEGQGGEGDSDRGPVGRLPLLAGPNH